MLGYRIGILLRYTCACRSERYVHILEVIIMLKFLYSVLSTAKHIFLSGTAFRTEKRKIIHREILFLKHSQKFLTDSTAGADYSYVHFGLYILVIRSFKYSAKILLFL